MNKFLLVLGVLSLLAACTKSESGDSNPGVPTTLSTISIADAEIIYKRASTSRAGSDDEGYWKIDHQGNESKIVMYDQEGNPTDMEINNIERLTDNLLLIEPASYVRMIADLKTEKLYLFPDISLYQHPSMTPYSEGADGMLYFVTYDYKLYKLDPQNFTVESVLPEGQKCEGCLVNKDGIIYYQYETGKFKLPNGSIIPYAKVPFITTDGNFYIHDYSENWLCRITPKAVDNIETMPICQFDNPSNERFSLHIINGKSGVDLFVSSIMEDGEDGRWERVADKLYEFDGTKFIAKKTYPADIPYYDYDGNLSDYLTLFDFIRSSDKTISESNISFSNSAMYSINLDDYSIQETSYTFPSNEYELYEMTADAINQRLLFTALRYEDGKVVIGEVAADGQISIINEKESNNKIINLIPLN